MADGKETARWSGRGWLAPRGAAPRCAPLACVRLRVLAAPRCSLACAPMLGLLRCGCPLCDRCASAERGAARSAEEAAGARGSLCRARRAARTETFPMQRRRRSSAALLPLCCTCRPRAPEQHFATARVLPPFAPSCSSASGAVAAVLQRRRTRLSSYRCGDIRPPSRSSRLRRPTPRQHRISPPCRLLRRRVSQLAALTSASTQHRWRRRPPWAMLKGALWIKMQALAFDGGTAR